MTTVRRVPAVLLASPEFQSYREADALAAAGACGRRAAAWMRTLPVPLSWGAGSGPDPLHQLAAAVEAALGSLDPADTDTRDPRTGAVVMGSGGVPTDVRAQLGEPTVVLGAELSADQVVRVLAIVAATLLAVDLHRCGDYADDLPTLCAAIDHAVGVPAG